MQSPLSFPVDSVTGLLLAGGRGQRMGGVDKGLQPFKGQALAQHVLDRLRPQVGEVIINANRHQAQYAQWGHAVVSDATSDFQGPLAGLLAGLEACTSPWLMSMPCDTPFVPTDLVMRLRAAAQAHDADIALPTTVLPNGQVQWQTVFLLIQAHLHQPLRQYLATGQRKIDTWVCTQRHVLVPFEAHTDFDNLNTLDELRAHE